MTTLEEKGKSQIKPRLGQGRTSLRCKRKTPVPPPINKPVVNLMEKPMEQPKAIQDNSRIHVEIIHIPDYTIPQTRSGDNSKSGMDKTKTILDVSREIPIYPDPFYRPLLKVIKLPMSDVPRSL